MASKIVVKKETGKNKEEVFAWLEENLEKMLNNKAHIEKITVEFEKDMYKVRFCGRTIKGNLNLEDDNMVCVEVEIPLLYRGFKNTIIKAIEEAIENL